MSLTPKQEKFCQKYIETGNASEAYRQAYNFENMKPNTLHRKAAIVLNTGKVGARLEELKAHHLRLHEVTVGSLTAELEEHRTAAFSKEQYAACNGSTMGKAKLHGLVAEKPVADLNIQINLVSFSEDGDSSG